MCSYDYDSQVVGCKNSAKLGLVVAQWRSGAVVQWSSGAVAQWRRGAAAQRRSGEAAQWLELRTVHEENPVYNPLLPSQSFTIDSGGYLCTFAF